MTKFIRSALLAARIWILVSLVFGAGWFFCMLFLADTEMIWTAIPATICATIGSLPVLVILFIALHGIERRMISVRQKKIQLTWLCTICSAVYGTTGAIFMAPFNLPDIIGSGFIENLAVNTCLLLTCTFTALFLSRNQIRNYFKTPGILLINKNTNMETNQMNEPVWESNKPNRSNKILYKGITTGALILAMMIPTVFITNLVRERQERQEAVAKEVSSRWSGNQTLSGPYIYLPYKSIYLDQNKKQQEEIHHLLFIPDDLQLTGRIDHELRQRSIYKVLLYRASLQDNGHFILQLPKDIQPASVQWDDAKICYGLSDFKGIEERLIVQFNGNSYELSPGLPVNDINDKGLSAPVSLSVADLCKSIPFQQEVKIKGSETLHFVPLSGNSSFSITSAWPNPSFDGSDLPSERTVTDSGFAAKWAFNKANLPFGTVLRDFKFDESALSFGVTMVQPADEYAKTNRSVKYAILIIGLTFSLFFIVELMQKKPIHPIQYVLIGLALVIFYSLLLAISEFILFDRAYLLASVATISLVSLYARAHFKNWKSAGIFGGVLTLLYGFIFVLIRLEDTALLIGSIGLFIILALTMYASKKINWYGLDSAVPVTTVTEVEKAEK
jgi:inner membrane protein